MKPKVFISEPVPQEVEEYISKFCDYKIWKEKYPIPKEILYKETKDIDGLMTPKGVITEEFLENSPNLKIVSNIAVGYEAFDIKAMKERKVLGTHTPYVLDETVADLAFGLILMTARKLGELDQYVKSGKWHKSDNQKFLGQDVHHSTLGMIGMGRIGEKVARRATFGFNMNVLYHTRNRRPQLEESYGIKYSNIESLLENSDFVLLMLPLTDATYQLIGQEQFKLMKQSAFFINCSRGKIVDEKALIHALETKEISGAGLDVFEVEPVDKDNPLLKMQNVVTLPHIGSATEKTRFNMVMKAAENLVAGVTNQVPPDVVDELRELLEN
ncbi:bifunctional glyoxylate/hydroxypyruvate reductase B [Aquibacillus halophilus]|uniref:Glyoxylate/hydroxypyruvate reductase B n=1 Tax=Aquibacillus halophilus TaxID=930132 RepID=A0A6A8DAW8_9BACI|nr:D-glycerate dehydrogenase [Aquibacillus halophilus]MRH42768.1 bifunctional glyoxylate/hydroxypyruvate reductase B [Aquibacillus halophilus]